MTVTGTRGLKLDLQAAFGAMGNPLFDLIIYWGCAAIAAPVAMWGGESGALAGTIVFSLALPFLAYSLGHGMLSFVAQTRETRLPGDASLKRRYSVYACVVLAMAGAVPILALSASHLWFAWVPVLLMLAVVLFGVMAPRPSLAAALMLGFAVAGYWQLRAHARNDSTMHLFVMALALSLAPAALAIAAAAKWRRVTQDPTHPRRPSLTIRRVLRWIRRTGRTPSHDRSNTPRTARVRWQGSPLSPVQIIRTSLGGLFAMSLPKGDPVLTAARGTFIALALILFAALYVWPWLQSRSFLGVMYVVAFAASGLLWTGYSKQIATFARPASGEFAELALMPGLGSGAALRASLYRALLGSPLRWLGAILGGGSIILLLEGASLSSIGTLILMMAFITLAYSGHTLLMLTRSMLARRRGNAFGSEFFVFVFVGSFFPLIFAENGAWLWPWVQGSLAAAFLAALALGIYIPARKLAGAPHPFLG